MTLDELMGKLDALRQQCSGDTEIYILQCDDPFAGGVGEITLRTITHTDIQFVEIAVVQDEEQT